MRVLLDTHTLLWFLLDDPRLSLAARLVIENPTTEVEVSPASYWEIAIKIGKAKYILPEPYEVCIRPAKNLLCTSVSLVVFRNHKEIRRCGASGA